MTFFYDINKKLQQVLEMPKSEHKQLNERDEGKPGKNFAKIAKDAGERYGSKAAGERVAGAVRNKLKAQGKLEEMYGPYDDDKVDAINAANPPKAPSGQPNRFTPTPAVHNTYNRKAVSSHTSGSDSAAYDYRGMEEGMVGDVAKKVGSMAKKVGGKVLDTLGHGSDEELRKDLQRKMGMPATGEKPRTPLAKEAAKPMTAKQKSFAKLAPPADKITFADKIAGAKKEVDEMLGDVAAEAMKGAVTRKIAGKRYGGAAQKDDEPQVKPAAPRGRGRPKKSTDTEQGAELKPDWSAFGVGKVKLPPHKGAVTRHKLSDKEPGEKTNEADDSQIKAAIKMLKKAGYKVEKAEEELEEKAVSKKQQKFMGMVHAAQKGEKPASKEVAKVAKTMKKKDAEDFAATKHKGLPEKAPKKKEESADKSAEKPKKAKKEKTEEAGGTGTPTASSGFGFGKGIYDSLNREIEDMIAESMNVSMNMSNDGMNGPTKSLTVTATDEDAEKLGALLKMAGVGTEDTACPGCGQAPCGCDGQMDEAYGDTTPTENAPEWPTETETSDDALQYAGGINKPKSTGQTTVPVIASQEERQHSYAEMEEDAIRRMMEMAGIKKKAVDEEKTEEGNLFTKGLEDDDVKIGDKIPGTNAIKKKDIDESIFALTNQWKAYKG